MSDGVQTKAWYQFGGLKGFEPGYLVLTPEQRLVFVGLEGARFDAPLPAVSDVKFPRHWFDGGCKLTIGDQTHRVDFVRPNGAQDVTYHLWDAGVGPGVLGTLGDATFVASKISDIGSGRAAGKQWKAILTAPR